MKPFPTSLDEIGVWLDDSVLSTTGQSMLTALHDKGYSVQLGITESDAIQLMTISLQASIRNYCPKDCSERFKDVENTIQWMSKGRVVFILKRRESGEIAGYGWSRPGLNDHIPEGTLTGALRISELHQGQGLATPFLALMLDYTTTTWPTEVLWYEAWKSNAGALHIYEKLGFVVVETVPSTRQTDTGKVVEDTRLYMRLRPIQS